MALVLTSDMFSLHTCHRIGIKLKSQEKMINRGSDERLKILQLKHYKKYMILLHVYTP